MAPTEEAVLFVCSAALWVPALPLNCTVCLHRGKKGKSLRKTENSDLLG